MAYPPWPVHVIFDEEAARSPHAVALAGVKDGESYSVEYSTLHGAAEAFASCLVNLRNGTQERKRQQVVATFMERSVAFVTVCLGTHKAGMVHVAPNPKPIEYAIERLKDCQCSLAGVEVWPVEFSDSAIKVCAAVVGVPLTMTMTMPDVTIDDVAYLMYTSGTTGNPKGVQVLHRGVVRLVKSPHDPSHANYHDFSRHSIMLFHSPTSFDASILEMQGPLLNGGQVVPFGQKSTELSLLRQSIELCHVNTIWLTARLFDAIVDVSLEMLAHVQTVLFGGEAMSPAHVRRFLQEFPEKRLVNGYGPTENAVFSTFHAFVHGDEVPNHPIIGRPIAGSSCYILDALLPMDVGAQELRQAKVTPGELGELWVGGDGVAAGYLNREKETRERFRLDPFVDGKQYMYRTGDMVLEKPDSTLEYHGRKDGQLKINGQRFELQEVQAKLGKLASPAQCHVLHTGGDNGVLVGFITGRENGDTLRKGLAEVLPDYMVPHKVVNIEALPLTPHGKVDGEALKHQFFQMSSELERPAACPGPLTDIQEKILAIFRMVLERADIGIDDGFADNGGNSLKLLRLVEAVGGLRKAPLPPGVLFEHDTARKLGAWLEENPQHAARPRPAPVQHTEGRRTLASFSQENMVFEYRQEGPSTRQRQNEFILLKVDQSAGQSVPGLLERAFKDLIELHEPMRTHFEIVDMPTGEEQVWQIIAAPKQASEDFKVRVVPLREEDWQEAVRSEWQEPFDLFSRPPFKVVFFQGQGHTSYLHIVAHHAVWDGFSLVLLLEQLERRSQSADAGADGQSYSQWSDTLRESLASGKGDMQRAYWREQLRGALQLPQFTIPGTPTPLRPQASSVFQARKLPFKLPDDWHDFCTAQGITPFQGVAAVMAFVVAEQLGVLDVVLGYTTANRQSDTMHLVGFFVNLVCLRFHLKPQGKFRELLQDCKKTFRDAETNRDVPFHTVLADLRNEETRSGDGKDIGSGWPFEVLLNSRDTSRATTGKKLTLGTTPAEVLAWGYSLGDLITRKYSLILEVDLTREASWCALEYDTGKYTKEFIERIASRVTSCIDSILHAPEITLASLDEVDRGVATAAPPAEGSWEDTQRGGHRASVSLPAERNERVDLVAQAIMEEWGKLTRRRVTEDDDFFSLGGNSLLAMKVSGFLREWFGVEIKTAEVQERSILQLAGLVAEKADTNSLRAAPVVEEQREDEREDGPVASALEQLPIAIVGAGVAGLMTAAECKRRGLPYFLVEQAGTVGGVWDHGCNTTSRLQTPKNLYTLEGQTPSPKDIFKGSAAAESNLDFMFPQREEVHQDIQNFASNNDLLEHCWLNTQLVGLRRDSGALTVQLKEASSPMREVQVRGLVMATGKHSTPGSQLRFLECDPTGTHSVHSTRLDGISMRDRHVLVVGAGSGGVEAATLAFAKGARKVTLLVRNAYWVLPRRAVPALCSLVGPTLRTRKSIKAISRALRGLTALHYLRHGLPADMVPKQEHQDFNVLISVSDQFFELAKSGIADFLVGDEVESIIKISGFKRVTTKKGRVLDDVEVIVAGTGYTEPNLPLPSDPSTGAVSLYKGYLWAQDPRVGFVGFLDMLGSHTKTIPLNIFMSLEAILHPDMRPEPKDVAAWQADPSRCSAKKAHVAWLLDERKTLAMRALRKSCRKWIVTLRPQEQAKARLLCLPHGGAGPGCFRKLAQAVPTDLELEVLGVQLPGHDARESEQPLKSLETMAEYIVEAIHALPWQCPLCLLGFSMGALLALKVATKLRARGIELAHLVVCSLGLPVGQEAGCRPILDPDADDKALLEAAADLQQDAYLREIVDSPKWASQCRSHAATLRADLRAALRGKAMLHEIAAGQTDQLPPVPITVFGGSNDTLCPLETLERWSSATAARDIRFHLMVQRGHLFSEDGLFHDRLWKVLRHPDQHDAAQGMHVETIKQMRAELNPGRMCELLRKDTLLEGAHDREAIRRLHFRLPLNARMDANPALRQVVLVEGRFYTPAPARDDTFCLHVKVRRSGGVSQQLDDLEVGESIPMCWPFPPVLDDNRRNAGTLVGLIAFGIAAAALIHVAAAELEDARVEQVVMLYATRYHDEQVMLPELDELVRNHAPRISLHRVVSGEEAAQGVHRGRVGLELIQEVFPWAARAEDVRFLVAGTPIMMEDTHELLRRAGFRPEANHALIRDQRTVPVGSTVLATGPC